MRAEGLQNVPLVVGGIIPPADALALKQMGVAGVYTPKDFKITGIMSDVVQAGGEEPSSELTNRVMALAPMSAPRNGMTTQATPTTNTERRALRRSLSASLNGMRRMAAVVAKSRPIR